MQEDIENFIKKNRKICWEAEYQDGEYCIGENKVREFISNRLEKLGYASPASSGFQNGGHILLTVKQVKQLAEFAGLTILSNVNEDQQDNELFVEQNMSIRIEDDNDFYGGAGAYWSEYPDEGAIPLYK